MSEKKSLGASRRSARLRVLVFTALLAAMSVILAFIAKKIFGTFFIRVTFENLPIVFCGVAFGPVPAVLAGVAADLCSCLFAGQAPLPLFTVGAASIGLISGLLGRYVREKPCYARFLLCELAAQTVGSILIKSFALHFFYQTPYAVLLWRVPLYIGIAAAESLALSLLFRHPQISKMLEGVV